MFPRIPGAVGGGGPCGDFGECGCERRCCSWCCRAASVVFAVRGAAFTGDVFAALVGGVRCLGFLLPVRFVLAMLFLLLVRSLLFLLPVRSLLFLVPERSLLFLMPALVFAMARHVCWHEMLRSAANLDHG